VAYPQSKREIFSTRVVAKILAVQSTIPKNKWDAKDSSEAASSRFAEKN
jgi:hypothetical protein